jgi:hypothetical protein
MKSKQSEDISACYFILDSGIARHTLSTFDLLRRYARYAETPGER